MVLENICSPVILYLAFSLIQIIIDIFKNLYNTAFLKFMIMIIFSVVLNLLCKMNMSIIAWFLVFIPFIFMTFISSVLLFVFGLNPGKGNVSNYIPGKSPILPDVPTPIPIPIPIPDNILPGVPTPDTLMPIPNPDTLMPIPEMTSPLIPLYKPILDGVQSPIISTPVITKTNNTNNKNDRNNIRQANTADSLNPVNNINYDNELCRFNCVSDNCIDNKVLNMSMCLVNCKNKCK